MPRNFLRSLDGDRRREIIGMVRNHRLAIREGREELKAKALAIADALAAEPYDAAALTAAVDEFGGPATGWSIRGWALPPKCSAI